MERNLSILRKEEFKEMGVKAANKVIDKENSEYWASVKEVGLALTGTLVVTELISRFFIV